MYVCHKPGSGNSHTLSISVNAVPDHLGHGDRLGSCDQTPCGDNQLLTRSTLVLTAVDNSVNSFKIVALSNPSSGRFNLQVQSTEKDPVTISIVNVYGQVVYRKTNVASNSTIIAGEGFVPGVYFAEAEQGGKKMILKLIRTN